LRENSPVRGVKKLIPKSYETAFSIRNRSRAVRQHQPVRRPKDTGNTKLKQQNDLLVEQLKELEGTVKSLAEKK
jgi:hypothetical protein